MKKIDAIKVRMYRHGFGDCFLVRFYAGKSLKYKMMIDCGLKLNDKVDGVTLNNVAQDIRKLVLEKQGAKQIPRIDVLIATHEHHDHVSAFHPSLALYDKFQFDEIWMAWTEDPEDDEAKQINSYLTMGLAALTTAAKKLKANKKKKEDSGFYSNFYQGNTMLSHRNKFNNTVADLAGFYGNIGVTKKSSSGISYKDIYDISIDTLEAFDHIKTKLAKNKSGIKYHEPGKLIDKISALPGIRMYILGPPRGKMINKEKPSEGEKKEVYFSQSNASMSGFVKGVLSSAGYRMNLDDGRPFGNTTVLTVQDAKKNAWYKANYFKAGKEWREIEDDWLDMAGSLALQMDSDTNNTSFVLAIEFTDSEKVLLFPGDAQVGNWLSWHNYEWEVTRNDQKQKVNARKLLNNTVLYKVGHHASHNATLKDLGLELMIHDDMVALIPEKEKQYNGIPYKKLIDRLKEKTRGRTIFSADNNNKAEDVLTAKPAGLSPAEWKAFNDNIEISKLFVEYTVRG
jgi:beta-lactamase superfamily II metal-dependent hydrolase